jgi:hypothetical protein
VSGLELDGGEGGPFLTVDLSLTCPANSLDVARAVVLDGGSLADVVCSLGLGGGSTLDLDLDLWRCCDSA